MDGAGEGGRQRTHLKVQDAEGQRRGPYDSHHQPVGCRVQGPSRVGLGLRHQAATDEDHAQAHETFTEAGQSIQAINQFLEKNELEFPQPIRPLVVDSILNSLFLEPCPPGQWRLGPAPSSSPSYLHLSGGY